MKAMVLKRIARLTDNPTPLEPAEIPIPVPAEGELLVKVSACGVCHTELDEIEGRTPPAVLPMVRGHQAIGRVAELGRAVTGFTAGDRVGIAWIFSACGACAYCLAGNENLCERFQATGRDAPGGYAEFVVGLANVGAADAITDIPEIISSSVHDRFPNLTWVSVEAGCGWIPYILEQLDDRWWRNRWWLPVKLKHEPSFYYRRNWRSSFMVDHYAVKNRHAIGVDNMMWSSDYPHHGCDWPETRKTVDEMMRDVPLEERRKLCALNAAKLYKLI